ncbi:EF hand family protein [Histomonas meleagridis]|uniref:EF hand family protein n=1 Tax=Histomonas meleagridis TaxID=135588 RepID=UPI00355A2841|nr:EF hand family protein [Histomonas meleagridis]KAH0805118.1 EF hand family protein [Histomonas meleagridis]
MVTQPQFLRALPFKDLSNEEKQALIQFYEDPTLHDVNYKRLMYDINQFINNKTKNNNNTNTINGLMPHQLQSIKPKQMPNSDVIHRFAEYVKERRIRIREFFQSNDNLHLGYILGDKFKSTLTLFGFYFTSDEIDFIYDKYKFIKDHTEYAKYQEFCSSIDQINDNQNTQPQSRTIVPQSPQLDAIIQKVRTAINRSRINVLPTFQGFDHQNHGFITGPQFHRALTILQLPISVSDLNVLVNSYGNENDVDYFKFIEDVDPTHNQSRRVYRPLYTDKTSIEQVYGYTPKGDRFVTQEEADEMIYKSKRGLIKKVDEHKDITSLLADIRRWSLINSVMFHDFLEPFDHYNCGEITIDQFNSGMTLSTYRLSESEFQCIVDNYSSKTNPGYIKWRQFADDISSAIVSKDLEKNPNENPMNPHETIMKNTSNIRNINIKDIPQNVYRILEVISRYVKSRREYYLGYNQLLFRFGTLDECGITQDKCIELYSPKKNAHVNHNEGVKCITWSIIPLVVGIASLIYTFTTTNVSNQYQALAMLIGLACVLPSLLCIFLGLILLPDFNMPCYFTGSQWF